MSHIFKKLASALLLCLASTTMAGTVAVAREPVSIEYNVPQGLEYTFRLSYALDQALTYASDGQSMNGRQTIQTTIDGKAVALSVENGRPTRLRLSFGPGSGTQMSINGVPTPQPFELAGRTAVVDVQNEKIIRIAPVDGGTVNNHQAVSRLLSPVVVFENTMRPGRPVTEGDQWTATLEEPDGSGETKATVTVVGLQRHENRQMARLAAQGSTMSSNNGVAMTGPVSSTILVDTQTGLPLETDTKADVQFTGAMVQDGRKVQIQGQGRLSSQVRIALIDPVASPPPPRVTGKRKPSSESQMPGHIAPGAKTNAANLDPKLVGVFRGEAVSSSGTGGSRGSRSSARVSTQLWWVFRADGIIFLGSESYFVGRRGSHGESIEWSVHADTEGNVDRGRWQTEGETLTINWDDGRTVRVVYNLLDDGTLVFRNPDTKKLITYYTRVH